MTVNDGALRTTQWTVLPQYHLGASRHFDAYAGLGLAYYTGTSVPFLHVGNSPHDPLARARLSNEFAPVANAGFSVPVTSRVRVALDAKYSRFNPAPYAGAPYAHLDPLTTSLGLRFRM